MQEKKETLGWIHKKVEFNNFINFFTFSEWQDMGKAGFKNYCENNDYSPEIGAAYLMTMSMVKEQMNKINAYDQHLFFETAKLTFQRIMTVVNESMTSNISAVTDWLGTDLTHKLEQENYETGSQIADLLSLEKIRIALQHVDIKYCEDNQFSAQDVRNFLRKNQMTFKQLLALAKGIQRDLANREMPVWTTSNPELFNIALKFNDQQLNALTELKFNILANKNSFELVAILRTVFLNMEENINYKNNIHSFKNMVIDVAVTQFHLVFQTRFLLDAKEFFENSHVFEDTSSSNILFEKPQTLEEQFFAECKKEKPLFEKIELLVQQGIDLTTVDNDGKTGLHYVCKQQKPDLKLVEVFIAVGCPISILISDATKIISQAIDEETHLLVLLLLLYSVKEEELCDKLKIAAQPEGSLIEKFIHLFVSVDIFIQMQLVQLIADLNEKNMAADIIMEKLYDYYAPSLKELNNHSFDHELILSNEINIRNDSYEYEFTDSEAEENEDEFSYKEKIETQYINKKDASDDKISTEKVEVKKDKSPLLNNTMFHTLAPEKTVTISETKKEPEDNKFCLPIGLSHNLCFA